MSLWAVGGILLVLVLIYMKRVFFGKCIVSFATFAFIAVVASSVLAAPSDEERRALEAQLETLERQIAEHEATITQYKTQGKTLQREIDTLNAKIQKLNLQIRAVNVTLSKLDREIAENQGRIETVEGTLALNRTALIGLLRRLYEERRASLMYILLAQPRLSDFFGGLNNILEVQSSLSEVIQKIDALREELIDQREQLAIKKNDAEALKAYQDAQRRATESTKQEKNSVLAQTKGQESKYQELLKQTKKTAAEIRSRIFSLIGGGELSFDEAYKFAKIAERATGVRAALILAVLDRESALGQNVGRCSYETAMHPTRDLPAFRQILSSLREAGTAPPEPILVSCANRDGLYGGAMGPAQFIPSTWKLYAAKVADITGSNPPNPWNNGDAFVATALYLKDAGAANASITQERIAAARYYAGGRWQRFLWTYGDRVVTRAEQFQQDIDVLNS